ncbi:MAG: hypothetical protein CMJ94_02870 [Planctomycetes bacterium]|nr:hypothetical protein [Planctomycetota bacterium]
MLLPALLAASTLLSPGSAPVWQDFDAAPAAEAAPAQRIWRIACLGDSITAGATLAHPRRLGFPEQLSARLNAEVQWEQHRVLNCGVGGATLLRQGDRPIHQTEAYQRAMESGFDHLVVLLGTHDTVQEGRGNWAKANAWEDDLQTLVNEARRARPQATVWLMGPPPMFPDQAGLSEARRQNLEARAPRIAVLQQRTRAFAEATAGVEYLSLEGVLRRGQTTDGVHPNPFGQEAIAAHVQRSLAPHLGLAFDPRPSINPVPSAEYRAGAGWNGVWWEAFERLRELPFSTIPSPQVVFFGDSITQGLTGDGNRAMAIAAQSAVSLGLSGDRTEHLRYRIRQGALRWWSPRVIVLQIGINNLNAAQHSPEDTAAGIHAVVEDLVRTQPHATILVCGPFPAGRTADSALRRKVDRVHELVRGVGADTESALLGGHPQVRYLDLRGLFLDDQGLPNDRMAGDALHISSAGKLAWLKALDPWVRAECERPLIPELPAALAWLRENEDYPLVSRSLFELRPGDASPARLAQPLLYSFDAHDPTELVALADGGWAFNAPVLRARSAPNVGTPLHTVSRDDGLSRWEASGRYHAAAPDSSLHAVASSSQLVLVDHEDGSVVPLLDASDLGQTMPTGLRWIDDTTLELDLGRVGGGTPGRMTPGRWQIDLRDRSEKRLGAVTQQTPPAPAGLAEASGAFAFLGQRKVEEFRVHAGWVALCVIEADWKRTIHLVRLETGVHYPLGPGLMPRWARTRTN